MRSVTVHWTDPLPPSVSPLPLFPTLPSQRRVAHVNRSAACVAFPRHNYHISVVRDWHQSRMYVHHMTSCHLASNTDPHNTGLQSTQRAVRLSCPSSLTHRPAGLEVKLRHPSREQEARGTIPSRATPVTSKLATCSCAADAWCFGLDVRTDWPSIRLLCLGHFDLQHLSRCGGT